ncbi:HNH endonuclease signature motif containing protein [Aeromicrobium endophyticum]|uniref:HNH endonuclease n=1 Tax=Aeromicrobium endophyticum TaxID=2292704 RepID=A0A371P8U5_9ACTN|nr:HNH endonuclease signature motif containing protein [Aeromicrobium endophyticum]REK72322.1 HNH endonuclease [Aeromicrobium endophyticum]
MATSTADPIDVLTDVAREQARAEARAVTAMLEFRDRELERIEMQVDSPMKRFNERSAIALAIGEAMGFSEGQVQYRLSFADTVRDHSPTTWAAFSEGRIDLGRVREIGHTISQLKRAESVHRLDRRVVEYAETHTVAELRGWLKRFVRRVEADLAVERADDEQAKRHVSFQHGDDSMGFLGAYLSSHELAAIENRIRRAARCPVDPDDQRTVAQREADLLVAWCLSTSSRGDDLSTGSRGEGVIDANIAVTVDADVLAGANPGFAESTDGRWGVPANWIADVVGSGSTFWHRIVVDPVSDDVLAHEYVGRFAPDVLSIALRFLYGTCQGPGCMVPVERCDIDHRQPWPEGPTRGDNLGPLCRRHHTYKGHGILHWTTRPQPARPAA